MSLVKPEESISIKIKHQDLNVMAQDTILASPLEGKRPASLDSVSSDIIIDQMAPPFDLKNLIENRL